MNNVDYPIGADNEKSPWNEKEGIREKVTVDFIISVKKVMHLYVDEVGNVFKEEDNEIQEWGEYIAKSLGGELIDFELIDKNYVR